LTERAGQKDIRTNRTELTNRHDRQDSKALKQTDMIKKHPLTRKEDKQTSMAERLAYKTEKTAKQKDRQDS
jgi:hypothetical protein